MKISLAALSLGTLLVAANPIAPSSVTQCEVWYGLPCSLDHPGLELRDEEWSKYRSSATTEDCSTTASSVQATFSTSDYAGSTSSRPIETVVVPPVNLPQSLPSSSIIATTSPSSPTSSGYTDSKVSSTLTETVSRLPSTVSSSSVVTIPGSILATSGTIAPTTSSLAPAPSTSESCSESGSTSVGASSTLLSPSSPSSSASSSITPIASSSSVQQSQTPSAIKSLQSSKSSSVTENSTTKSVISSIPTTASSSYVAPSQSSGSSSVAPSSSSSVPAETPSSLVSSTSSTSSAHSVPAETQSSLVPSKYPASSVSSVPATSSATAIASVSVSGTSSDSTTIFITTGTATFTAYTSSHTEISYPPTDSPSTLAESTNPSTASASNGPSYTDTATSTAPAYTAPASDSRGAAQPTETQSYDGVGIPSSADQSSIATPQSIEVSEPLSTNTVIKTSTTTQTVSMNTNWPTSSYPAVAYTSATQNTCDCTVVVTVTHFPGAPTSTSVASTPDSPPSAAHEVPSSTAEAPGAALFQGSQTPTGDETSTPVAQYPKVTALYSMPVYNTTVSGSVVSVTIVPGPTNTTIASYGLPPAATNSYLQVTGGAKANNVKLAFLVGFFALAALF